MSVSRRSFIKGVGEIGLCGALSTITGPSGYAAQDDQISDDLMGVLVDIPECVGCRKCEFACQTAAGFDVPSIEAFEDKSVFATSRRPSPGSYTVVNEFPYLNYDSQKTYVKTNCFHCLEPACVSACLVGALAQTDRGAVVYDANKCMGCRYCMVACPFQIPTYDYDVPLTPQVRKCNLCADKIPDKQQKPACVKICPKECLIYGRRSELIALAHEKIQKKPDRYVDHVYGEHEVGGTAWLYLSSTPFESLDFIKHGSVAPSELTEMIQHGVFKQWGPPLMLYGLLGAIMWIGREQEKTSTPTSLHSERRQKMDDVKKPPKPSRDLVEESAGI